LIAHISGELARIGPDHVVVDVGGVGYKVFAPLSVIAGMPQPGSPVKLLTYTHVKEDALTLYGFAEEGQQAVFEMLLGVTGIGPKVALNILSVLPVEHLVDAIAGEDALALHRIPGVGSKTAQRIVLELRGNTALLELAQRSRPSGVPAQTVAQDVVEGLIALGYSRSDARAAAEQAAQSVEDKSDTGAILRQALRVLTQVK